MIYAKTSTVKKDAFYELVLYPIRSAQLSNRRFFHAELAKEYLGENLYKARLFAVNSIIANAEINKETDYFN